MTFSNDVRRMALSLSNGFCQCSEGCIKRVTEFHHRLSNTKVNQKLYPIFLHSLFNCCPINRDCHMTKPLPRISVHEAAIYEEFLRELIKIRR